MNKVIQWRWYSSSGPSGIVKNQINRHIGVPVRHHLALHGFGFLLFQCSLFRAARQKIYSLLVLYLFVFVQHFGGKAHIFARIAFARIWIGTLASLCNKNVDVQRAVVLQLTTGCDFEGLGENPVGRRPRVPIAVDEPLLQPHQRIWRLPVHTRAAFCQIDVHIEEGAVFKVIKGRQLWRPVRPRSCRCGGRTAGGSSEKWWNKINYQGANDEGLCDGKKWLKSRGCRSCTFLLNQGH